MEFVQFGVQHFIFDKLYEKNKLLRISDQTVDEVKARIDIVDIIGDFVNLKKSGQNFKGLSPFTNEKTPSFFVSPSKGIYKCFSSGNGGDAISFVMEYEGMSYLETIKFLAQKYGIEVNKIPDNSNFCSQLG